MEFFVNDLSMEGQFNGQHDFKAAIGRMMAMRLLARRYGRDLFCNRSLAQTKVTETTLMIGAVKWLDINQCRAFMQWITQTGPFWDDIWQHDSGEWLDHNGAIVTGTALGEAAWCCLHDIERMLVSFTPSNWTFSPISVDWVKNDDSKENVDVRNF